MKNPTGTSARVILSSALFLVAAAQSNAQDAKKPDAPIETIEQLRAAIEDVLKETHTPAVGVAIVNAQGPVWIAGLGKADVEKNVDADSTTMFRIGSTSKMFVALSILKLQEEGRLKLEDKVHDLVPELAFENKWESTDPIRVAHLLEHTTGWDDIHLAEYAHNDSIPISLKDGLAYHPHSRTSRWVPGTRMSYCNAGPPTAALIVERLTGKPFEEYVQENFFRPLGMGTMTYFRTDTYRKKGATLYIDGKPQKYWNIIMRPSGSINASPVDMARMVSFFINGAMVDTLHLINPASLLRMETPTTTSGARAGMRAGYGLNNYTSPYKGFVYQSHNGGVNGGLTDLSYLPGYGIGYVVMINAGNGNALDQITRLIREFQTKGLPAPIVANDGKFTDQHAALTGYYIPVNPRQQMFYFLERALNVQRLWSDSSEVHKKGLLGGKTQKFWPVTDVLLKSPETGMTNFVSVTDPLVGAVVHEDTDVMKRTNAVVAWAPLVIGSLWLVFILSSILFSLLWSVRYWMGRIPRGATIRVRMWPLIASLLFAVSFILIIIGIGDPFEQLGAVTPVSAGIMITTLVFALASLWSLYVVVQDRKAVQDNVVYWHSAIGACLHVLMTAYFAWFGVIGLMTWR